MKEREIGLLEKRAELKRMITEGMEDTTPAFFFNVIGRGLARLFRLKNRSHWFINAMILGALLFLPGMVASVAAKEMFQWRDAQQFFVALVALAYLAAVISHINIVFNVLPGVRDSLVDSITSLEDLEKLHSWLKTFWTYSTWATFMVIVGILYGLFATIAFSNATGSFMGIGLTILVFSISPFYVIPIFNLFYMLSLPFQMARYDLDLYESDPSNSEVIQRLIVVLNIYIYIVAGYMAVVTALVASNPTTSWAVYPAILLGWFPTIMQFLANQYGIRKIIIRAKWRNLNRLQAQISELQDGDLTRTSEDTITRLNRLMDLHDRISARPNSILNWGTGLSFLNQLMLPLLGLLLGNIDKLLKLIARTP